jgi:predicted RNase H-like nuclease (RuvC/YqgF family)
MSYWKAIAAARDIPATELREKLTEALFELACVDAVLDDDRYHGQTRADAIQGLREERREANEAKDEAEEKLEARIAEERGDKLRAEYERIEAERDELRSRLSKVEPLLDAYSDLLAHSRRFVTLAEGSGVKPRHVRRVGGKKASER